MFPRGKQLFRIYAGMPVLLFMVALVIAVFMCVQTFSNPSGYSPENQFREWIPRIIPILNAVCIIVLDLIYTKIAYALTQWENHRTIW